MEPFKSVFSEALVLQVASHLKQHLPDADADAFVGTVLPSLDALELKARAALIAERLHAVLPADPGQRASVLQAMLHPDELDHAGLPSDARGLCGWAILPLTLLVARHGVADFDRSMALLREMTKRFSAEFGVRAFLRADQARALHILSGWVADPNRHVRRLVSEGTRPRLPWGERLPGLVRDPSPMLSLLTRLRDDPEPYVRRSVANHLNDIARDHPDLVRRLAGEWLHGADANRRALLRHACRGLIRRGDAQALAVFGHAAPRLAPARPERSPARVCMGEALSIRLALRSTADEPQRLAVDYVLHLLKANGRLSPKVFKGAIIELPPRASILFERSHRFREVTTRRHYPGRQALSVRINGVDTEAVAFELLPAARKRGT
ncbi:MAG: DNA alkylation repair protein [bacterium]|nr:DNA alkylation repair protein [Betaproteobacteria bacterium]